MTAEQLWSIGELAERAGVTVKTVRFYSERGLLPAAGRSAGGHRRYGPGALERLRLIRTLRALGLPVAAVAAALDDEDALDEVIAAHLAQTRTRLTALRWREAALHLLDGGPAAERAERLRLLGALPDPPGTAALARFWRRWLPPRLPAGLVTAVLDQAVPVLPADPTPDQVLSLARLHALVAAVRPEAAKSQPATHQRGSGHRPAVLYEGLIASYGLAVPHLLAGRPPHPGDALDSFVAAHADSLATRDTPAFRRALAALLIAEPRLDAYWSLTARLSPAPDRPTPGSTHAWLRTALLAETAA